MSISPMSPRTEECFSRTHPSFHPVLRHLRTPLCPLVSSTTGLQHPDFPKNLLSFHLLTSAQLDNLARHFHQVWPPLPATTSYPVMVQAWLGLDGEVQVDLSTKRRRFGRFIGLRGCESPVRDRAPETAWSSSKRPKAKAESEPESAAEMLVRMEREWDECLLRKNGPPTPPLVKDIYTADPSAHVFNNKIYIYPSHDRETDIQFNDNGDQYDMVDYHVYSMDSAPPPAPAGATTSSAPAVTDHGVVLADKDVPWAAKQLWAPDAATKNGKYYLYFPARAPDGLFRMGVAVSDKPEGPFTAEKDFMKNSYSIDPASFVDDDGQAYMYFGGIWGGQLQCWSRDDAGKWVFDASKTGPQEPKGEGVRALFPRVARLTDDMLQFDTDVEEVKILAPETGEPLAADDHERRFFEAAWMHKYQGKYYLSYSTGDTHFLVYAVGDNPWGPFTYRGRILEPVLGWTTHHSIVEFQGRWWLFYHDCELSKGVDHLRSVRMREIGYDEKGDIHLV
ncbi:Arabinanase/levansucrase/invertase [Aspergillus campestris IBT 28561]|uniref:Arabinanase/levansucrase/invertase n=1 Tax=Aspergillus campestris (strain IBT 28561) TaxID=1392248 RepID=A0A2I1DAT7_ASPC2|nr:Arabinanase/levansucrase/invertase [Aspergillus campestris IBT 28561]PKY06993.1 Arabinanase/levansucrase/invertase [Aspergillus campestris IBT 28561]